jgi:acyl phosphate:glycerol-3-phosphate acyltransferase
MAANIIPISPRQTSGGAVLINPNSGFYYLAAALAILVSYFIGAFPHLLLLCRLFRLPTTGDLHHTLWQRVGPVLGLGAILVDVLKGTLAVWLSRALGFDLWVVAACGLAAVAGQMWPVFHKFYGEKGNTTGAGMALALAFMPTLIAVVPVFFALLSKVIKIFRLKGRPLGSRFKSGAGQSNVLPMGVALAFLILPLAAYWLGYPSSTVAGLVVLLIMVMFRRLTAGLSHDFKDKRPLKPVLWYRLIYDRGQA